MSKDKATAALEALESIDPEKLTKALSPIVMTFLGAGVTKRHLRKSIGLDLSYWRVYHSLQAVSWLAWFVSRNVTTGYLQARDSHETVKSGLKKEEE